MKRKALLIILTALLPLLFQADAIKAQSKSFTIKGVIDTVPHTGYSVSYWNNSTLVKDTITLDAASKFEYTASISEPTIFNLRIGGVNPLFRGPSEVYSFWVEPGKVISFEGKTGWLIKRPKGLATRIKQSEIKNSSTEIIERNFSKIFAEAKITWEKKTGQSITEEIETQLRDSVRKDFIQRHPNEYYSLYLLSNTMYFKPDFENSETLFNTFSKEARNTYLGKVVGQQISNHKFSGIGKVMPEFEQTDTSSRTVKLSDYRGKYVLIDFWASWCGPCRIEHPQLLAMYKKYASKGFEILSISVDGNKENWTTAIQEDQLPWVQVSDLRGMNNSIAKSFLIRAVPDNFLLDPNGVIIAKKLRGKQLEQKMDQIFKDK